VTTPTWLLLIYTIPTEPSRKRAFIWRKLKEVGALYLRDGVAILPEREDTLAAFRSLAARIREFAGQATLVTEARLDQERAEAIMAGSRAAREAEYADVGQEAEAFLQHIRQETTHHAFSVAELEELVLDLGKLQRWMAQIRARDYFGSLAVTPVNQLLSRCEAVLSLLRQEAWIQDETTP
jgi:DNA-binding transcriptional regulator PaaX